MSLLTGQKRFLEQTQSASVAQLQVLQAKLRLLGVRLDQENSLKNRMLNSERITKVLARHGLWKTTRTGGYARLEVGTVIDASEIALDVRNSMPFWNHIGVEPGNFAFSRLHPADKHSLFSIRSAVIYLLLERLGLPLQEQDGFSLLVFYIFWDTMMKGK
ncbi:hypothetical protein BU17DRAFT_69219 [Hysterangium stoloniferum]|nr:hypothetical protein BU17DRAFT_69219 [Hysterangium stoloniferum]